MEAPDIDQYLKSLDKKGLKKVVGQFHKPRDIKIKNMKKDELKRLCEVLMKAGETKTERKTKPTQYGAGLLDFFKPIKKEYNNVSTNTIKKYGNSYIQSMKVVRTPIMKMLEKALDVISFGQFSKANPYDKLYHLALVCDIGSGSSVIIEKNETINISTSYKITDKTEQIKVHLKKAITLNQLLENGQKHMGNRWFPYDPLSNNCQNFIKGILDGNSLNNSMVNSFVFQDLTELKRKLPSYVGKIARVVTDTGARFNQAIGGANLLDENGKPVENFNSELQKSLNDEPAPVLKSGSKKDRDKYRQEMNAYNKRVKEKEKVFKDEYKGQITKKLESDLIAQGYTTDSKGVWRKPASLSDVPLLDKAFSAVGLKGFANRAISAGENLYNKPSLSTAIEAGKVMVDSAKSGMNLAENANNKLTKASNIVKSIGSGSTCPTCGHMLIKPKRKGGTKSLYNVSDFI